MLLQIALMKVTKNLVPEVPRKTKSDITKACAHLLWYDHTIPWCKKSKKIILNLSINYKLVDIQNRNPAFANDLLVIELFF